MSVDATGNTEFVPVHACDFCANRCKEWLTFLLRSRDAPVSNLVSPVGYLL
jgi:hypothetical protein